MTQRKKEGSSDSRMQPRSFAGETLIRSNRAEHIFTLTHRHSSGSCWQDLAWPATRLLSLFSELRRPKKSTTSTHRIGRKCQRNFDAIVTQPFAGRDKCAARRKMPEVRKGNCIETSHGVLQRESSEERIRLSSSHHARGASRAVITMATRSLGDIYKVTQDQRQVPINR